jgi:copper chaperone
MTTLKLAIEGMSCSHCLNAVNKSLAGLPGVRINSVAIGRAELEFDPAGTTAETIVAAIGEAGYRATAVTP